MISYSPRVEGELANHLRDGFVVEIDADGGPIRSWVFGLLLDRGDLATGHLNHAVPLRIIDPVAEDGGACGAMARAAKRLRQPWPCTMLSPSTRHDGRPRTKSAPMVTEQAPRGALNGVFERQAPLLAGSEQVLEGGLILRRRDDQDFLMPASINTERG